MYCRKCGKQIPDTAKFCPKCGARVIIPMKLQEKADQVGEEVRQETFNDYIKTAGPGPAGDDRADDQFLTFDSKDDAQSMDSKQGISKKIPTAVWAALAGIGTAAILVFFVFPKAANIISPASGNDEGTEIAHKVEESVSDSTERTESVITDEPEESQQVYDHDYTTDNSISYESVKFSAAGYVNIDPCTMLVCDQNGEKHGMDFVDRVQLDGISGDFDYYDGYRISVKGELYYDAGDLCMYVTNISKDDGSPLHEFEIIEESLTWDEAKRTCEQKGGHLATCETQEELDELMAELNEYAANRDTLPRNRFYIGAELDPNTSFEQGPYYWITDTEKKHVINDHSYIAASYWHVRKNGEYEPSYKDDDIAENVLALNYFKGKWELNDMCRDVYAYQNNEAYANIIDKIGYVCEYSVNTVD